MMINTAISTRYLGAMKDDNMDVVLDNLSEDLKGTVQNSVKDSYKSFG